MAENSKIEWTDHTFNPWIGCTAVSPACDHCYAEEQDKFRKWTSAGWGAGMPRRRTSDSNWKKPLQWNRAAAAAGTRPRVFCASLADVFDAEVPDEWRGDLFHLIHQTPHLDWLLLTKRPQVALKFYRRRAHWPENIWLGVTAEDQKHADLRIPVLFEIPAKVRFVSYEPALGHLSLRGIGETEDGRTVDWVICGGESGSGARPMPVEWAREVRQQCAQAGVAFFMKQLSQADTRGFKDFGTFPADLQVREFPA